ncbi:DNA-binding protein [Marinobacter sp.]|uniref:DNA-binding protein n=1 Tax=Marinobacter sp. TaxID=50741 RepID=UPI003A8E57ED
MARGGINKALVQKAYQAILARGGNPSIDAIRVELGNTGSKTTIHRYLKELEESSGRDGAPLPLNEQLANLVGQLSDQLKADAQASVAKEREQLGQERIRYQALTQQAEARSLQLEDQCKELSDQLKATQQALSSEQHLRQENEVELARLAQANLDLERRVQDRDAQIRSLEDKHQHARDALEHYRQANKEQREQEQRRHESQAQQLQLELRQLQQTLIVKQDELTHLNRDNARLLAEARQQQKDQHAQQQLLAQSTKALKVAESTLAGTERTNAALEERCHSLQEEVTRLGELTLDQAQEAQSLNARLAEAIAQLKLVEQTSGITNNS